MKTIPLLIMALLIAACGSKPAQIKQYHRLPVSLSAATTTIKPLTLVVARPEALSILGGRPMVATQADGSLIQLSHNFWLESPKILLQDTLIEWAKNHWQQVQKQAPYQGTYQQLETRILGFEKNGAEIHLKLAFKLTDANRTILLTQTFEQNTPIQGEGYAATAQAIGHAISDVLTQLQAQLP